SAEKMVQALLDSQWPEKPAPKLYQLFSLFLELLPQSVHPSSLSTAFLLKVLRHEGILQLSSEMRACSRCAGERYPTREVPFGALDFSFEEEALLTELALCRSMTQLSEFQLTMEFIKKIESLFFQAFN